MTNVPTPGSVIDDILHGKNAVEGSPITLDTVAYPDNSYTTTGYYSYSWKNGLKAGDMIRTTDLQMTWNPYYSYITVTMTAPGNSTVTCNGVSRTVAHRGSTTFTVMPGTYTVTASCSTNFGTHTASQSVSVGANATQYVTLKIPYYFYSYGTKCAAGVVMYDHDGSGTPDPFRSNYICYQGGDGGMSKVKLGSNINLTGYTQIVANACWENARWVEMACGADMWGTQYGYKRLAWNTQVTQSSYINTSIALSGTLTSVMPYFRNTGFNESCLYIRQWWAE